MRTQKESSAEAEHQYTERWLKGIPYEVAFWRSYYSTPNRRRDLFSWSGYGGLCSLEGFDVQEYIGSLPYPDPVVVDLGCGMSYAMGNFFQGKPEARVEFVDPLAAFYNKILNRYAIDRPEIQFGMIENLSACYKSDSVDLIHVRNALDHCLDPMRGIIEALACLRVGGVLYLNHFRNEATRENYRGFHQWNIDLRQTDLVLWNNDDTIYVVDRLGDFATIEAMETLEGRIVAVIRKVKELPLSVHDPAESALRASRMLMETVEYFQPASQSLKYQFSRLYTTVGHRLMRLLPYSLMNRVKALMGKK